MQRPAVLITGSVLWLAVIAISWSIWSKPPADKSPDDGVDDYPVPVKVAPKWSADGLPEFKLINQNNESVSKSDLIGQPWVASFIFTQCAGTCPRVTGQLRILQDRFKSIPIRLVSISVQPEKDTPESLLRYAKSVGADLGRWHFLTGDKDVIFSLIREGFLQYVAPARAADPEPGWEVEHSNNVCLVDASGRVVGKYNALVDDEIASLRGDVDKLINMKPSAVE